MLDTGSVAKVPAEGYGGKLARGHLLAKRLGGSGADLRNITPIYQNPVNNPIMRGFEDVVYKRVNAGEIVSYEVTPIYKGEELVPTGITIVAKGNKGLDLQVSLRNIKEGYKKGDHTWK